MAKRTEYILSGAIPKSLIGKKLTTPEAESLDEFKAQVQDGSDENILVLAQGALDIKRQHVGTARAKSAEIAAILSGHNVDDKGKVTGENEFADLTDDERTEHALADIQTTMDAYVYGAKRSGTVGTGVTAKARKLDKAIEAAANDPELQAKLAALGII